VISVLKYIYFNIYFVFNKYECFSKNSFSRFDRSIVFERYHFIELNFGSIFRARKWCLKNCYSIFAKKHIWELQTHKHVNSIPAFHKRYDIKMIVIVEDFAKLIAQLQTDCCLDLLTTIYHFIELNRRYNWHVKHLRVTKHTNIIIWLTNLLFGSIRISVRISIYILMVFIFFWKPLFIKIERFVPINIICLFAWNQDNKSHRTHTLNKLRFC
jgi:hypothetical protein